MKLSALQLVRNLSRILGGDGSDWQLLKAEEAIKKNFDYDEVKATVELVKKAIIEIGVPDESYPANISNAYDYLKTIIEKYETA